MSNIPRKEYPRPQFVRENWINLNGTWAFEIDNGRSGEARGLQKVGTALSGEITVPFCPESELSGVQHTDFMYGVWYKRTVTVTEKQLKGRAVLHFGAVDYCAKVFVNGELAGTHKGGYVSFEFDVTALLKAGENEIAVYAEDNTRDRLIPSGKQSEQYNSYGCFYTRTTGIWQTVWLEFTPKAYISRVQYYQNITSGMVTVTAELVGTANLTVTTSFEGKEMGSYTAENACGTHTFTIKLSEKHLWDVGCGNLYDVAFAFGEDNVTGYFGLREVRLDGHKFRINGRSVFQRLVLDQGFYPDGIWTAPSDEALKRDIELSMEAGFNGARLHQKVFEERFYYWADKMGYLTWGEASSWGMDCNDTETARNFITEWSEIVQRDRNHPSLLIWTPTNEEFWPDRVQYPRLMHDLYNLTKMIDPTRPFHGASGGTHIATEIGRAHV